MDVLSEDPSLHGRGNDTENVDSSETRMEFPKEMEIG